MVFQNWRLRACVVLAGLTAASTPLSGMALPEPTINQLRSDLTTQVQERYPTAVVKIEIVQKQKLYKPCEQPSVEITGQNLVGRIPLRVRCHGQSAWSYFIHANIQALESVFLARHPIKRGTLISTSDLRLAEVPINPQQQYFANNKPIIGQLAARNIAANQPIHTRHLKQPLAVQRGDLVIIRARHGAATISATGKAMQSGHVGEQIPVKNTSSQRIVHSWIVAKGLVATQAARG